MVSILSRVSSPRRRMGWNRLLGLASPDKKKQGCGPGDLGSRVRSQRTRTPSSRPTQPRCAPRGRRAAPHPSFLGPVRWRPGRSRQNGRHDGRSRWDDALRLAPIRSENPTLGSPGGSRRVGWTIPDRSIVERERTSDGPIKLRVHHRWERETMEDPSLSGSRPVSRRSTS